MFAVVEWLYERSREVSVVPLSWIVNDEHDTSQVLCYWPSGNVKASIIKRGHPPSQSWPTYPVRLLRTEGKITPRLQVKEKKVAKLLKLWFHVKIK